jgi:subtilase family serine protease
VGFACIDTHSSEAATSATNAATPSQVRDAELTPLGGNSTIAQVAVSDLGAVSGDTRAERMILQLKPSDEQKQELAAVMSAQLDPSSPQFHQWLTPAEFGARFGVAQADLDKVTAWLTAEGFQINEIPAGHQTILF